MTVACLVSVVCRIRSRGEEEDAVAAEIIRITDRAEFVINRIRFSE